MSVRPLPAGIVDMRVARLLEHGVSPDIVHELAEQQIRCEIAQHLKDDDNRTVPGNEAAEKLRMRYDGADPTIAGIFEAIQFHTPHKPGGSDPVGKPKKAPPRLGGFGSSFDT